MLDTATIGCCVVSPSDPQVKELRSMLWSGEWIPYLTWHQVEELVSHADDEIVRARVDFIRGLPHVAFLRRPTAGPNLGCVVDVRDIEVSFLANHPGISHDEVIDGVRPQVRSGFCTGAQLVEENLVWWRFFRTHLAPQTRLQNEEIANLTHFPVIDVNKRLPEPGKSAPACSIDEARRRFARIAAKRGRQIVAQGHCRNVDPLDSASRQMWEAYEEWVEQLKAPGDLLDTILKRDGVRRDRLPNNPTIEDVGYEAVFVAQIGIHARRLLMNRGQLLRTIRKERLPAWVIWEQIDRRIKQLATAEIGNVNDKLMLSFGPYVDVVNVDKRIAELLRQAARDHGLLRMVYQRVPERRGLQGLVAHLKKVSA